MAKKFTYPPRIFKTHLQKHLETCYPEDARTEKTRRDFIARTLKVSPPRAQQILDGCDLKLSDALLLAHKLDTVIADLWEETA